MKKLGIVITNGVAFRNFMLCNYIKELLQQDDAAFIYFGLLKRAYKNRLPSHSSIKEL